MRVISIFIILSFLAGVTSAQQSSVVLQTGIGSYSMRSQKTFRDEFLTSSGLPMKIVDNFPIYYSFGLKGVFRINDASAVGAMLEYMSTGGRLDYKDYSGHALLDQALKATQYGVYYQFKINHSEIWQLFGTVYASAIFTTLD